MKKRLVILSILLGCLTMVFAQAVSEYTFNTVTDGSLEDMSTGTTTLLTGYSDSGATPVTDFGFTFNFAGTPYTQFSANANGLMRFGPTAIGASSVPVSGQAFLGPISGDNSIQASGKIHYKVVGTQPNRKLVVEWLNLRVNYSSSDTTGPFCTLQAWLYETSNRIDFVYGTMYNRSTSAQSRAAFISTSNVAGSIGCVATITTTPSWVVTGSSLTTTSFSASSYMTNLNSSENGSRRVFTFLPPVTTDPPNPALLVYPANDGWAFLDATLSWASGGGMPTTFDVYFGDSNPPPLVSDDQTGLTYTPTLAASQTYYWQVIPRNDNGEAINCPIWSFNTPAADQLTESFEVVTPFLPPGWANPGSWSGLTTSPFHGARVAYKSASTTPALLSTPMLVISNGSSLDFYYRTAATTGYGRLQIKSSPDRVNWSNLGAEIVMPTTTGWNYASVDLSGLAAFRTNLYLGFEVYTTTSTASIYLDHVFGPPVAAIPPGPVTLTAPTDGATGVSELPTFTWTAPVIGGVPTGYTVYCDTNPDPVTSIGTTSNLTFTADTALAYGTLHYWKVVAQNGSGNSVDNPIRSFTTRQDPTISTLPYLEGFEEGNTHASTTVYQWNQALDDGLTKYWTVNSTNTSYNRTPRTGSFNVTLAYNGSCWLFRPILLNSGITYEMELWARQNTTDPANANIGMYWGNSSSIGAMTNTIAAQTTLLDGDYQRVSGTFTVPSNGTYYLGIKGWASNATAMWYISLDDILVREAPAGLPDHVTLTSPANGSTNNEPANVILQWAAAFTGGIPDYYEVLVGSDPIDPGIDYYGDFAWETSDTFFNLSAQVEIDLGYSSTWYWAVLPYNGGDEPQSPDPNSPDFMKWEFTTVPDPSITEFPYSESFDGTQFAPPGWTNVRTAGTGSPGIWDRQTSGTYPTCAPHSGVAMARYNSYSLASGTKGELSTPPLLIPEGDAYKLSFWMYRDNGYATYSNEVVNVYINSTPSSVGATLLGTISRYYGFAPVEPTANMWYEYSFNIPVQGTRTARHIIFEAVSQIGNNMFLDDVSIYEALANDMGVTNLTVPNYGIAEQEIVSQIAVRNYGSNPANSYTVKLMSSPANTVLASLVVNTPLAAGDSYIHNVPWTPATGGEYSVYGMVDYGSDQYAGNNSTATKTIYVAPADWTVFGIGNPASTSTSASMPIYFYYKNSISETIYFEDELRLASGAISAIVYKNSFSQNLGNKPVKIWVGQTTEANLSGGWIPAVNYNLVFDGMVNFPSGVNEVIIPFQTPYNFTGGNIIVRVYRPYEETTYNSTNYFYYTSSSSTHPNRSRYAYSSTVTYDPLAPSAAGTISSNVPNTWILVDNAVMQVGAVMQGYVYQQDGTTPIVGATVTLTERYATTTDNTGFYQFTFWENINVTATASMPTYYSQTVNANLTMGNTVNQNFILTAMPRVTVSGTVTANDFPGGLVGADIAITGAENYAAVSGVGGAFSIPNVLGSSTPLAYTIEVSKEGYQTYSATINVGTTALNLGTINLVEFLWTPYNLVATHSGNNAQLVWEPAAAPDYIFFDFEEDNGGWVNSSSWSNPLGDWEWTNTYNVANFVVAVGESAINTVPPTAAHSGTGFWGTKINTNYTNSSGWNYLTKTLDLSGFTGSQLRFWHWNNVNSGTSLFDKVQVKVNGNLVWGPIPTIDNFWQETVVNLSAYDNQTNVVVQFEMYASSVVAYAGWYIDDVYIGPATRDVARFGTRNGNRALQNYDVYRFLAADEGTPANWSLLNAAVADTSYTDTGFAAQAGGTYKWAVKANYSGGLESDALISNSLGRVYQPQDITAINVGTSVQLSWAAQPGASFYKVYAADNPYGTYTYIGFSLTNGYTITSPTAKKFYKVTAGADETPPSPAPAK